MCSLFPPTCNAAPISILFMFTERGHSFSSTRPNSEFDIGTLFQTISILRIGAGLSLLWFHAWHGAIGASRFLWREQPWAWVDTFTKAALPVPHLAAPAAAAFLATVAVSWTLGFLTRLFALIAIPLSIAAILIARHSFPDQIETAILYLFISLTLLLFGSGNISLDGLFRLGRGGGRKKKPATF
jgi:uncharacterized membrane protein YphA (DoxX/SURF4 family)